MKELIIRTSLDLSLAPRTEVEIQGVKGPSCTQILEALSLRATEVQNTSEYHEPQVQLLTTG